MNLRSSLLRGFAPAVTALAIAAMGSAPANAASLITGSASCQIGYNGCTAGTAPDSITNPSTYNYGVGIGTQTSYNFVYTSLNAATSSGATGVYGSGVALDANTGTGTKSVASGSVGTGTYDGGAILALDSDFPTTTGSPVDVVIQTTQGDLETITFEYAASQQNSNNCDHCTGPSNDTLSITDPNGVKTTEGTISIGSQDFSGWYTGSISFIADTTGSETFTFLATSTTAGVPSFALIDNLQVTQTNAPAPEPNSLILLGTGLAGLGGLVRSRFTKATIKA